MIADYLGDNEMRVAAVSSGREVAEVMGRETIDLLILDVRMPGEDGMQIARKLREDSGVPIIMLTGRHDEADRVMGLELGADDYIAKPFGPRELLARIRAVMRRSLSSNESERVVLGSLELDVEGRRASYEGRSVELTSVEFELLVALAQRAGRVVTREAL